jgi:DNA-binding XRE family transcriptional regulator
MDKALVRERRNRMLDAAAVADLSLAEGLREMRAISGMTLDDFARHRGVSAQVIRALELD